MSVVGSDVDHNEEPIIIEDQLMNPKEQDFINAKSYLLAHSSDSAVNLYDHLISVIKKVLDDKPANACNTFEEISSNIKSGKFTSDTDTIQNKEDPSTEASLAVTQQKLFKVDKSKIDENDEEIETPLPNLMQTAFYFEQAGIGLNREEMFRVWLAMRQLVADQPVHTARFWGKLLGRDRSYYVVEAEYRDGEDPLDKVAPASSEGEVDEEVMDKSMEEDDEGEEVLEDVPEKPDWKPAPEAPLELNHTGVNKKTYFVCNVPGESWIRLPLVTPAQLACSRQIRKFLTGDLEAAVVSYPPFPGNEAAYLRAQIARISAGTQISPQGFYQFDEEEEEEEEEGAIRENFIENPEFEGVPVRELADTSLANWVHHTLHILPQGRCKWWNPAQKKDEVEDEEDEEEDREEPDEPEPESGPPLLTPISEDTEVNGQPSWTTNISSNLISQFAVAVVSSNLWPGAHAFAFGKTFENVYIGWGQKYAPDNMSPTPVPPAMMEFPSGPEITEADDPTPEDEAAFKASQAEAEPGEGEEEQEEEEEEEDD